MRSPLFVSVLLACCIGCLYADNTEGSSHDKDDEDANNSVVYEEEDYGDGLKVLVTYRPDDCEHRAKTGDIIHYHYVGRLGNNGQEFGKSFDYDSPYIVSLGQGRIIAGMDRGLKGTCLWERRRITIPPHLGYGERGVGSTIPPNSVLVFYIRMIRIERNGHALGEDERLEDIYQSGLYSYSDKEWNKTVDMMEETIRLFTIYENHTLLCLRECHNTSELTASQRKIVKDYNPDSVSINTQFMSFAKQADCIRQCKKRTLPPHLRQLDPEVVAKLRLRKPYSYLHFAYYQLGDFEQAARCCFTYHHYNPTDENAVSSIPFYRAKIKLADDQFIFREALPTPGQISYEKGRLAYNDNKWLEAVDMFENALLAYKDELFDCRLLCEDSLIVNISQTGLHEDKAKLYEENNLIPDTLEYHELLKIISQEVLECKIGCVNQVSTIEGSLLDNYMATMFNYLQFSYYKLGQLKKAAESASTFMAIDPSDIVMANNVKFYKTQSGVPTDVFQPRNEYVNLQNSWENEKRLLYFAKHGERQKRTGVRGDKQPPTHSEL